LVAKGCDVSRAADRIAQPDGKWRGWRSGDSMIRNLSVSANFLVAPLAAAVVNSIVAMGPNRRSFLIGFNYRAPPANRFVEPMTISKCKILAIRVGGDQ
jgi:hypothetical protein